MKVVQCADRRPALHFLTLSLAVVRYVYTRRSGRRKLPLSYRHSSAGLRRRIELNDNDEERSIDRRAGSGRVSAGSEGQPRALLTSTTVVCCYCVRRRPARAKPGRRDLSVATARAPQARILRLRVVLCFFLFSSIYFFICVY